MNDTRDELLRDFVALTGQQTENIKQAGMAFLACVDVLATPHPDGRASEGTEGIPPAAETPAAPQVGGGATSDSKPFETGDRLWGIVQAFQAIQRAQVVESGEGGKLREPQATESVTSDTHLAEPDPVPSTSGLSPAISPILPNTARSPETVSEAQVMSAGRRSLPESVGGFLINAADQIRELQRDGVGVTPRSEAGSEGSGVTDSVLGVAASVLKSALGVTPLIRGLIGLFAGSDEPQLSPLVKYALPPSIEFQSGQSAGMAGSADYDQRGMPRIYREDSSGTNAGPVATQITVNVQAMDARSLLDRSSDIAAAVREAMLNLSSINDVVADL